MKHVLIMGLARGAMFARVAANNEQVTLAGIIDPDEQKRQAVGAECGLPASKQFADFASAAKACDAQILVVATPNHLHTQHTTDGLNAGLHVLCEKPLTTSRKEAQYLLEQSQRTNRQVAVVQNYRFGTHFRKAKELLDAGAIGQLVRAAFDFRWWKQTKRLKHPHAILFNHGVHHIDLLRYITGVEATQIHAFEWDPPEGDSGGRLLRLTAMGDKGTEDSPSRCAVCYDASYAEAGTLGNIIPGRLTLNGTRGTLEAFGNFEAPELWLSRNAKATGEEVRQRIDVPPIEWIDIDRLLLENFARAIESGQRLETDISDNLQTLDWLFRAAEVIEQSASQSTAVH